MSAIGRQQAVGYVLLTMLRIHRKYSYMNFATISTHFCWDDKPSAQRCALAAGAGVLIASLLLLLSLLLFALLGTANMGDLAGAPIFQRGLVQTFFAAVVWAPLFETLIGQLIPIALLTWLGARDSIAIVVSAILFSVGHVASGGGLGQGFITLIGGLCFASVFSANMRRSLARAFVLTAISHATNNALALLLSFGFDF